jgi:hypothetical protein
MSLSNFLFQGAPPPSVTQYGTKAEGLPQWLSDYTQGLLSKANAVAAEPYQAYGGPRIADFTGDQQNAFTQTRTAANAFRPDFDEARDQFGQATGFSATGASNPFIGAASGINAMGMAQPYMAQAAQTFPGQVQNYMNPYTDQVVDRIGDLGARNLSEKLMPAIGDQFIRAGQMGSSRHMGEVGKALRDTQESVLAQQSQALERGYGQAGQLFNQDAGRMAGLAGQAGNLALGQQGALGQLGQLAGNMQSVDAGNALRAGDSFSSLGQREQAAGLTGAAALDAVGQQQQRLGQANLDLAYEDFQRQRDYPQNQLGMMSNIVRGVPYTTSSTSSQTGFAPAYQPSGLSQISGALSMYNALGSR